MALKRRAFLQTASSLALPWACVLGNEHPGARQFRLWACGDSHVGTDLRRNRESLADAIPAIGIWRRRGRAAV